MDLRDLRANSDYILANLSCRLMREKKVKNEDGHIEITDNGVFRFIQVDQIYDFTVDDEKQDKLLREFFNAASLILLASSQCKMRIL